MEALIALAWIIILVLIFLGITTAAYFAHIRGDNLLIVILPKLIVAIGVYLISSFIMMWPMFLMIYAGAHTEPVGSAFSLKGRLLMLGFVFVYAVLGWLACSFVYGSLVRPHRFRKFLRNGSNVK